MLFYQDGLEEDKDHTLNITNVGANGTPLSLSSVTVYGRGYANNIAASQSWVVPSVMIFKFDFTHEYL